jgi:hypothetical protein
MEGGRKIWVFIVFGEAREIVKPPTEGEQR